MVTITLLIDGWRKDVEISDELFRAGVVEVTPSPFSLNTKVIRFYRDYQNTGVHHSLRLVNNG